MRIHLTARAREAAVGTAIVVAAIGLVAPWVWIHPLAAWRALAEITPGHVLLAAGILALLVLPAALVVRTEEECALCGLARKFNPELLLMASRSLSVCADCAAFCLSVMGDVSEERGRRDLWFKRLVLGLPKAAPSVLRSALFEAMVEADPDPANVRQMARVACETEDYTVAGELRRRIPEKDRTSGDWIDLGVVLTRDGRHQEALDATLKAAGDESPTTRALVLNNSAWIRSRLFPGATEEQRTAWLGDVREAARTFRDHQPAALVIGLASCLGTEAELQRLSGRLVPALRCLDEARRHLPPDAERLLIQARVEAATGESVRARAHAEQALRLTHPRSRVAGELRALMDELG